MKRGSHINHYNFWLIQSELQNPSKAKALFSENVLKQALNKQ